jgi:hypothetical protein
MNTQESERFRCTYLLPIRRVHASNGEAKAFAQYFRELSKAGCEVLVVDGSPPEVFAAHTREWDDMCRHVTVDKKYTYLNGKVNGVHTGVDLASCEHIVLADDDIRYTAADIARACAQLEHYELLRPQNYIAPLPWWGRTESARMLINRGTLRAGDYPGTCAFRRSTCLRVGHYDGDVLFDNEELVRHFALKGADILCATDFFVLKLPPSFAKWIEQRPRYAYEDFVMRAKTALFASLIPAALALGLSAGLIAVLVLVTLVVLVSVSLSLRGLLRDRAYHFLPARTVFYAPLWVLERSLATYFAFYWRLRYGGYPFGDVLLSKSTGRAWVAGGRVESRAAVGRVRAR